MTRLPEGAADLGVRYAVAKLDELMRQRGVADEVRNAVTNSVEMMYEYIDYAAAQGKDPADRKILAKFLLNKGKYIARYFGKDAVNCGLAILDFMQSTVSAGRSAASGNPPLIALTWGMAMLDLIEVGNSCEPAQRAYYELFLKQSTVRLAPLAAPPAHPIGRSSRASDGPARLP